MFSLKKKIWATCPYKGLHAISVFDKVYKWSPEKIAPQKHH